MGALQSVFTFEPWNRLTAGLMGAMFVARGLDFLSTRIVTPKLEFEANCRTDFQAKQSGIRLRDNTLGGHLELGSVGIKGMIRVVAKYGLPA